MSTRVSDFLPYVLPYAPGCPSFVAERAVVDAAIEFCEGTLAIQRTLDPVSVVAGEFEVEFDGLEDMVIHDIRRAWYLGRPLDLAAPMQVQTPFAYRSSIDGTEAASGAPGAVYPIGDVSVGLHPVPAASVADALTVRVSLKPKRGATYLDDALYREWVQAVADKALSELLLTEGQPYFRPQSAALRAGSYRSRRNAALLKASMGLGNPDLSVRPRRIA